MGRAGVVSKLARRPQVVQINSDRSPLLTVEAAPGATIDAKLVIFGKTIQSRLTTVTLGDFYIKSPGRQAVQNILLYSWLGLDG